VKAAPSIAFIRYFFISLVGPRSAADDLQAYN